MSFLSLSEFQVTLVRIGLKINVTVRWIMENQYNDNKIPFQSENISANTFELLFFPLNYDDDYQFSAVVCRFLYITRSSLHNRKKKKQKMIIYIHIL